MLSEVWVHTLFFFWLESASLRIHTLEHLRDERDELDAFDVSVIR